MIQETERMEQVNELLAQQRLRNVLKDAIEELQYVQDARPGCGSDCCATSKGKEIIERGEKALAASQDTSTGWLIERKGPEWLNGFGFSATWTKGSIEAIRFSRRQDADKIAEVLENEDISITEHRWGL